MLDPARRVRSRRAVRGRHELPGARASCCWYPGGISETELLFPYGNCCFASKAGQLAGNHFLTITQGGERLRELGVKTLWEGAQPIRFERA